ncbi:MAG TPA: hypothetical protein VH643_09350 [Gemmataceae bacterium]|jgi:hypothetical protein
MAIAWFETIDTGTAYRRAGGRSHYNSVRRFQAAIRRRELARLLCVQGGLTARGMQTRLARQLGVSRSTVCRDVAWLLRQARPCRCCGALTIPPPEADTGIATGSSERDRDGE